MRIESLRVLHHRKGPGHDPAVGARLRELLNGSAGAFHLDSCQRQLWACSADDLDAISPLMEPELDLFEGADAYRFLLRVATGLESQVVGETDIFGQLKEAWRTSQSSGDPELGVLMQRLFEDTKDIRSRYLQNLGGASYGSLVRMMLKQNSGPTLIVGAGQLAQSVAPYLLDPAHEEIWLLNRSTEKLEALKSDLESRLKSAGVASPRVRIIDPQDEAHAWAQAASVVLCIPFDPARDAERLAWRQSGASGGSVIHLGGHRGDAGAWNGLPGFQALDDLFALQKAQGDFRLVQVRQAARACDEKAKLRTLGASVSIPHGWEDLAVFA